MLFFLFCYYYSCFVLFDLMGSRPTSFWGLKSRPSSAQVRAHKTASLQSKLEPKMQARGQANRLPFRPAKPKSAHQLSLLFLSAAAHLPREGPNRMALFFFIQSVARDLPLHNPWFQLLHPHLQTCGSWHGHPTPAYFPPSPGEARTRQAWGAHAWTASPITMLPASILHQPPRLSHAPETRNLQAAKSHAASTDFPRY